MWPVEVIGGESTTYGKLTQKWRTPDRSALIGLRTNGRTDDRATGRRLVTQQRPLATDEEAPPMPFHSIHSVAHVYCSASIEGVSYTISERSGCSMHPENSIVGDDARGIRGTTNQGSGEIKYNNCYKNQQRGGPFNLFRADVWFALHCRRHRLPLHENSYFHNE